MSFKYFLNLLAQLSSRSRGLSFGLLPSSEYASSDVPSQTAQMCSLARDITAR